MVRYEKRKHKFFLRPSRKTIAYSAYSSCQLTSEEAQTHQLVGVKIEYYMPQFQMMNAQGKTISWNWEAFLAALCGVYRLRYSWKQPIYEVAEGKV